MQKAKHKIDPMEQEYVKRHGKLPDYHFDELWRKYGSSIAGKMVQDNIDAIWKDMQEQHSPTFRETESNPFEKSDN